MSITQRRTSRGGVPPPSSRLSHATTASSNRSVIRLQPIQPPPQPQRLKTPQLPDDVLKDEGAALYVSLFKHNIAKAQRQVHLQHIKAVALDAADQIDVEAVILDEESRRLRVLASIAGSLKSEFDDRAAQIEQLERTLEGDALIGNDPVLRVVREGLLKRQMEHDLLQLEIKRKRQVLLTKRQELEAIQHNISKTEAQAAVHASNTQSQQTTTLSEFLGLQSEQAPSAATKKHLHGDPPLSDRDEWLKALRIRRGDNMFEVFKESHANPLTMLLSPKANFGHRREEAKRTLETIMHLSPVQGATESFSGASEAALFDVEEVAAVSTALEAKMAAQREHLQHRMIVLRDPARLRALDTFQKYEDPRGTFAYVATTPLDLLHKQRMQFLQMFESWGSGDVA